jgi:hypothetical protein
VLEQHSLQQPVHVGLLLSCLPTICQPSPVHTSMHGKHSQLHQFSGWKYGVPNKLYCMLCCLPIVLPSACWPGHHAGFHVCCMQPFTHCAWALGRLRKLAERLACKTPDSSKRGCHIHNGLPISKRYPLLPQTIVNARWTQFLLD